MTYHFTILVLGLSGLFIPLFGQTTEWNLDFEEWDLEDTTTELWHDTTIVDNRIGLFPPNWHYRSDHIPEGTGLGRTTDATEGNYAVALSGFYSYQVMRIISGEHDRNSGWPIDFRPEKLVGDYKAILLGSCDSLRTYVDVYLTAYNFLTHKRDTIGQSNIVLNESATYEQFELDISYSDESLTPDTVIVVLAKERFGFDVPPACLECSHVFFDNLTFTNAVSIQHSYPLKDVIHIFPNPSKDRLLIDFSCEDCLFDIAVLGINGQIIKQYLSVSKDMIMHTHEIGKGMFVLRIFEIKLGRYKYEKVFLE